MNFNTTGKPMYCLNYNRMEKCSTKGERRAFKHLLFFIVTDVQI